MKLAVIVLLVLVLSVWSVLAVRDVARYVSTLHTCRSGHYETVHVKAWTQLVPTMVGKVLIMTPIYHPEHDERRWVCDETGRDRETCWGWPAGEETP